MARAILDRADTTVLCSAAHARLAAGLDTAAPSGRALSVDRPRLARAEAQDASMASRSQGVD